MTGEGRYSRQVLLPFIGPQGQRKLSSSAVAVVGLGALGCVASDLLARAGVGRLSLVDRDLVELNNLQRQTLYGEEDVEMPKATAARERLRRVNSDLRIEGHVKDINYRTVMAMLNGVDTVVDGTDNLETRYLLNEACVKLQVPFVYGAALGSDGMTSTLWPPGSPCLRCLFPSPPRPGSLPTCETAGILNATASLVGSLQASQALRFLLTGQAGGWLHVVRGWEPTVEGIRVSPREGCSTCTGERFEYLEARRKKTVTQLCGRDTVSVDPLLEVGINLEEMARRLSKAGRVKLTRYVLIFEAPSCNMTIFPDGRALIRGANTEEKASSLYARYIGH